MRGWMVVGLVIGCGPIVEGAGDEESSGDPTTTTSTPPPGSTSTGTTAAPTTAPPGMMDLPAMGECQVPCLTGIDCCLAFTGDATCHGLFDTYPYRFTCHYSVCWNQGCGYDEDCGADGYVCVVGGNGGECRAACSGDTDCAQHGLPGWVCNEWSSCDPPGCIDDAECLPGEYCNPYLGYCTAGCTADDQCAGLGTCDLEQHECVCTTTADCPQHHICADSWD